MPSMAPSQAGPAPIAARNAGRTAVAVSWLQSLNRLVRPTPRTVRLSQACFFVDSGTGGQFTSYRSPLTVQETEKTKWKKRSDACSQIKPAEMLVPAFEQ